MGKNKGSKNQSIEEQIAFLTDDAARQRGVRSFRTGGTAGSEPVGNLPSVLTYLNNKQEARDKYGLVKGEINPFVTSTVPGQDSSKQMLEYWASETMPQLPKSIRNQYDVVFAGTREPEPEENIWNTKFGNALHRGEQNVWKFVRKPEGVAKEEDISDPISAIASLVDKDGDRPVTVGTTTYVDPNRAADPSNFLSTYIRSTAMPRTAA